MHVPRTARGLSFPQDGKQSHLGGSGLHYWEPALCRSNIKHYLHLAASVIMVMTKVQSWLCPLPAVEPRAFLNLSMSQVPHLYNGGNGNCLTELSEDYMS